MIHLVQKLKTNRSLFKQLVFTVLAFSVLVILSYFFMSAIVRNNLLRITTGFINYSEKHITETFDESKTALINFATTAEELLLNGSDLAILRQYVDESSDYLQLYGKTSVSTNCFYLYLEGSAGASLIHSDNWETDENYQPEQQSWYQFLGQGEDTETNPPVRLSERTIVETVPAINKNTGETAFTYAVRLQDANGRTLGVACLDVRIDNIKDNIVNTALNQGGYGILINQELLVLAHPHTPFVGRHVSDPIVPFSKYAEQLKKGENISEGLLFTYLNEPGVAFFHRLSNGWYLGIVSPREQYYQSTVTMTYVLIILGIAMTLILCGILIHIDSLKTKAITENQQKSTFLANMSHEIRTPLNAIVGMTAVGKTAADLTRKDYCFTQINDASQHLLCVINDILDVSKMDANKLVLVPAPFYFNRMLEQVHNVIGGRIEERQQKFLVTADSNIPPVLISDEYRLRQVFINLLSNAIKFTPDGGDIYLHINLTDEKDNICTITAEVIDTGIGIAPENLARIFQSFEQADSSTSRKYGGTGLGLVIARRIVEMMRGEIRVTSTLGEGSRFTFSFQAARGEASALSSSDPADKSVPITVLPGELKGCRILLAEDVEINREIILMFMEETGVEIDCAENGRDVLRLYDRNPDKYDLILMDVQMPEMDGLEATRLIRERGGKLPIIATTANVFKEDIESCLAAGMDDHLSKPLNMPDVVKMIHKYRRKND